MTPPPIASPRRRKIARATLWGMVSFAGRRSVDMLVLWLVGRYIERSAYGLFRQWIAVVVPLYILVAGGWDIVLLRHRRNKSVHFRALSLWAGGSAVALGLGMLLAGGAIAQGWYRMPELAPLLRWAGAALICEAGRRAVRSALADRLDFGVIAVWELVRATTFGALAGGIIFYVGRAPEPPDDSFVATLFVGSFILAEFVEALGLLLFQRAKPGAHVDASGIHGPHAELWSGFGGAPRDWWRVRAAFRREARFCSITSFDTFFNAVSVSLPVYFFGRYYGPDSVTLFSFAFALATVPLYAILESAQRALLPSLSAAGPERMAPLTMLVVEVLSLLTMPLALWLGVFAPDIFVALFKDPGWEAAGYMTRCLLLFLALAPMTKVCDAIEAIKGVPEVGLTWNLTTFGGRALVLSAAVWFGGGPKDAMLLYGVYSCGMWALYQTLIARMLGMSTWEYCRGYARFAWLWVLLGGGWLAAGALFPEPGLLAMIAWGFVGGVFYIGLLGAFHRESFRTLLSLARLRG